METLPISKFKATCLAVIERIRRTGEGVLITKKGQPVAQVLPAPVPARGESSAFGSMAGTLREVSDILEPLGTDDWEALR